MAKPSDTVPQKVQEAIFGELLSRPENQVCADCTNKGPTWVSIDYGVFLCMRCSGTHFKIKITLQTPSNLPFYSFRSPQTARPSYHKSQIN